MSIFKKQPEEQIKTSYKKIHKYCIKRDKLDKKDPNYEKKYRALNNQMQIEYSIIDTAKLKISNPANVTNNTTIQNSVNYNKQQNGIHLHAHYHSGKNNTKKSSKKK